MEWIELVQFDALPHGEVLAANFKPGTFGYKEKLVGYLRLEGDVTVCSDENTVLENVTHYIPINDYDPK